MMGKHVDYSLYLVTDERYSDLMGRIESVIPKGVTLVQYRAKYKDTASMINEAIIIKQICDQYNIPLLINDRVDVALAVKARGVHLGQSDMSCRLARKILGSEAIIGISVHNILEARRAVGDGADYLGVGAVFATDTKEDVSVIGLSGLSIICQSVNIPVVAIGGVNFENRCEILKAGATGTAMVTALLGVRS